MIWLGDSGVRQRALIIPSNRLISDSMLVLQ